MLHPEQYSRAKTIFLAASRLPKGDRTRFLNHECGEDRGLAQHVRSLLVADEEEPEFLQAPALEVGSAGLAPGTRLGRFTIERLLGEGGMGVVYEAQEDEPSRRVALKLIRPGFVSSRLRSRFRHEIRVLGQLRHPGIAQIYEAGTLGLAGEEVPYFAMELVSGRPLIEGTRGLGVRDRLVLIAQICDAVHHAHQKGVIHRDLKPGNILVEEVSGTDSAGATGTAIPFQVKILDFGIARAADPEVRSGTIHTDAGQLIGTLAYMSPEQAAGDPEAVDTRSDVYAIGVIGFEVLSGRHPQAIEGRGVPDLAKMVRDTEPARLGALDRALRGDVETIIGNALEKEREHRYQSAAELASDIRRHLRDEPIIARPASALYQLRKFARRHKPLVIGAALALAAMAGATVVSTWQARVAVTARANAEIEQGRANRSADAARLEARRATLAATAAAIESGDPITARRMLEGTDAAQRGWAWQYWHARLDDSIAVLQVGRVAGGWISQQGDGIAVLSSDGTISRGSAGAMVAGPVLAGAPFTAGSFSADGSSIVAVCGKKRRSLDRFDAGDGKLIRHIADLPAPGVFVETSDDGDNVLVAVKAQSGVPAADDVWLWLGESEGRKLQSGERTSGIAMARDGRGVVFGYAQVNSSGASGIEEHPLPEVATSDMAVAISGDGAFIAAGGANKTVRIRDVRAGKTLPPMRGHAGNISALAFDPDAAVLASAGTDLTIRLWDVKSGNAIATLAGHTSRIRKLEFSRDGSRLMSLSTDGAIRVWSAKPYEGVCVLRGHGNIVYGVAMTPDGSRIVSGAWDQTVRVWDAASGECRRVIAAEPGVITALAMSPDGRTVATGHKIEDWKAADVKLWDIDSGLERGRVPVGRGELFDLSFGREGLGLWCVWEHGGVGRANVLSQPPTAKTLIRRSDLFALAVSADERWAAYGGGAGRIAVIDAATGAKVRDWVGHKGRVTALAFHPKLGLLASGSVDGTVKLWNADTGEAIASLERHWDKVYCVAFSPDGDLLASGSEDTTIRLWDVASASELTQLRGHEAFVYSLAFSPDGSRLVSGSGDRTVRVWDTRPVHERWRARGQTVSGSP